MGRGEPRTSVHSEGIENTYNFSRLFVARMSIVLGYFKEKLRCRISYEKGKFE